MNVLELDEHPEFAPLVTVLRKGDVTEILEHGRPLGRWMAADARAATPASVPAPANPLLAEWAAFRAGLGVQMDGSAVLAQRADEER